VTFLYAGFYFIFEEEFEVQWRDVFIAASIRIIWDFVQKTMFI